MLSAEDATRDLDRYRALTKEHAEIGPVVARFREYSPPKHDLVAADEIAHDPGDARVRRGGARDGASARMTALAADLQRMLLPKDPNDERNVFLEIRAGTGGDESALFAGQPLPDVHALSPSAGAGRSRSSRSRRPSSAATRK